MTKEEFENLIVKEIAEVCRKTVCKKRGCYDCPYTGFIYPCVFTGVPKDWINEFLKQQNKL